MTDDGSLIDGFEPEEGNKHADCSFDDDNTPRVEEVYNEDGTIKESKLLEFMASTLRVLQ